nr:unnamed protein product [Callosobruchus chinensis]
MKQIFERSFVQVQLVLDKDINAVIVQECAIQKGANV